MKRHRRVKNRVRYTTTKNMLSLFKNARMDSTRACSTLNFFPLAPRILGKPIKGSISNILIQKLNQNFCKQQRRLSSGNIPCVLIIKSVRRLFNKSTEQIIISSITLKWSFNHRHNPQKWVIKFIKQILRRNGPSMFILDLRKCPKISKLGSLLKTRQITHKNMSRWSY